MAKEIELAEPELVPMGPADCREAVRLLAALLVRASAGGPPSRRPPANLQRSSRASAAGLPLPEETTGKPEARESAGGTG